MEHVCVVEKHGGVGGGGGLPQDGEGGGEVDAGLLHHAPELDGLGDGGIFNLLLISY